MSIGPSSGQKNKGRSSTERRLRVAALDGWVCQICLAPVDPNIKTGHWMGTVDHIIPVSKGGTNRYSNLRLAHKLCNEKRGNAMVISVAK